MRKISHHCHRRCQRCRILQFLFSKCIRTSFPNELSKRVLECRIQIVFLLFDHPPAHSTARTHTLVAFKPFIKSKRDHNWLKAEAKAALRAVVVMVAATAAAAVAVVIYLFASFQVSSGKSYFPHNMLKWWYRLLATTTIDTTPCCYPLSPSLPLVLALSLSLSCSFTLIPTISAYFPHGSMCQLLSYHFLWIVGKIERKHREENNIMKMNEKILTLTAFYIALMQTSYHHHITKKRKDKKLGCERSFHF